MLRELKSFFLAGAVAAGMYLIYKVFRRRRSILDSEEPSVNPDLEIKDGDIHDASSSQYFADDKYSERKEDESGSSSVNPEIEKSSFLPQLDANCTLINRSNPEYISFPETTKISTEYVEDNLPLNIPKAPRSSLEDVGEYGPCPFCRGSSTCDCLKQRLEDALRHLANGSKTPLFSTPMRRVMPRASSSRTDMEGGQPFVPSTMPIVSEEGLTAPEDGQHVFLLAPPHRDEQNEEIESAETETINMDTIETHAENKGVKRGNLKRFKSYISKKWQRMFPRRSKYEILTSDD